MYILFHHDYTHIHTAQTNEHSLITDTLYRFTKCRLTSGGLHDAHNSVTQYPNFRFPSASWPIPHTSPTMTSNPARSSGAL
jgi:hypothetical protein